jgi:hypothetical protein
MTTHSCYCGRQGGESSGNKRPNYLKSDQMVPVLTQVSRKWHCILKPVLYVLHGVSLKFIVINFWLLLVNVLLCLKIYIGKKLTWTFFFRKFKLALAQEHQFFSTHCSSMSTYFHHCPGKAVIPAI